MIGPDAVLNVEQSQAHAGEIAGRNAQLFDATDTGQNGVHRRLPRIFDPLATDDRAIVDAPLASEKLEVARLTRRARCRQRRHWVKARRRAHGCTRSMIPPSARMRRDPLVEDVPGHGPELPVDHLPALEQNRRRKRRDAVGHRRG